LEILGWQLGVIVDNLALRQQLVDGRQQLAQETRYYREHGAVSRRTECDRRRFARDTPRSRRRRARGGDRYDGPLLGETGVGKELFAREIHNQSARGDAPFVAVHIAALAPGLVASALFGHERGAFTGAVSQAQGRSSWPTAGRSFWTRSASSARRTGCRLLRVLQEGTFERGSGNRTLRSDFRLVVATNRDLEAEMRAGRFRQDLYYRLNVFPFACRRSANGSATSRIWPCTSWERSSRRLGRSFEGISQADMDRLMAYAWPATCAS